jgi:uncharacterized SAM-binding protein YcdF (DUF218 family)
MSASLGIFVMLSLPLVACGLMDVIEQYPSLSHDQIASSKAQAIVILGGGAEKAEEYGGEMVTSYTLERIHYGAHLHRMTNLPILVTGGFPQAREQSEAAVMSRVLQEDFGIQPAWLEERSRNTAENAIFTRNILAMEKISDVILVTHAWHMARAVDVFENEGLHVTPAPTAFEGCKGVGLEFSDFLPDSRAFSNSTFALHEILGRLWYWLRY